MIPIDMPVRDGRGAGPPAVELVDYEPRWLDELVPMWRESFETALGIKDPNPLDAPRQYFLREVLPKTSVRLAVCEGRLVGFVAASPGFIGQLYVRVGWQGRGIGSRLLDWAKERSRGHLWLHTFALNRGARRFYERHGFVAVEHGFEPFWNLADVKYEWKATGRIPGSMDATASITLRRVAGRDESLLEGLGELLADAVHGGASVGFLAPLTRERTDAYWRQVMDGIPGGLALWVAEEGARIVGSVQLDPCRRENGRHRGEVQKLFVLRSHRGRGVSSRLLAAVDEHARSLGLTLLVLDTESTSPAAAIYEHLGWQKVGEVPDYAGKPDGRLIATAYYYKRLPR